MTTVNENLRRLNFAVSASVCFQAVGSLALWQFNMARKLSTMNSPIEQPQIYSEDPSTHWWVTFGSTVILFYAIDYWAESQLSQLFTKLLTPEPAPVFPKSVNETSCQTETRTNQQSHCLSDRSGEEYSLKINDQESHPLALIQLEISTCLDEVCVEDFQPRIVLQQATAQFGAVFDETLFNKANRQEKAEWISKLQCKLQQCRAVQPESASQLARQHTLIDIVKSKFLTSLAEDEVSFCSESGEQNRFWHSQEFQKSENDREKVQVDFTKIHTQNDVFPERSSDSGSPIDRLRRAPTHSHMRELVVLLTQIRQVPKELSEQKTQKEIMNASTPCLNLFRLEENQTSPQFNMLEKNTLDDSILSSEGAVSKREMVPLKPIKIPQFNDPGTCKGSKKTPGLSVSNKSLNVNFSKMCEKLQESSSSCASITSPELESNNHAALALKKPILKKRRSSHSFTQSTMKQIQFFKAVQSPQIEAKMHKFFKERIPSDRSMFQKVQARLEHQVNHEQKQNWLQSQKEWLKVARLKGQVSSLSQKNSEIEKQLASIKVFLFMVIHDLKHPTEAIKLEIKATTELIDSVLSNFKNKIKNGKYQTNKNVKKAILGISNLNKSFLNDSPNDQSVLKKSSESPILLKKMHVPKRMVSSAEVNPSKKMQDGFGIKLQKVSMAAQPRRVQSETKVRNKKLKRDISVEPGASNNGRDNFSASFMESINKSQSRASEFECGLLADEGDLLTFESKYAGKANDQFTAMQTSKKRVLKQFDAEPPVDEAIQKINKKIEHLMNINKDHIAKLNQKIDNKDNNQRVLDDFQQKSLQIDQIQSYRSQGLQVVAKNFVRRQPEEEEKVPQAENAVKPRFGFQPPEEEKVPQDENAMKIKLDFQPPEEEKVMSPRKMSSNQMKRKRSIVHGVRSGLSPRGKKPSMSHSPRKNKSPRRKTSQQHQFKEFLSVASVQANDISVNKISAQSMNDEVEVLLNERKKLVQIAERLNGTVETFGKSMKKLNVTSAMMMNLLQDLLDLGQIDKNSFQLNNEYFDLMKMIEKAFMVANGIAELKDVKLKMPEISGPEREILRQILGDERRYIQIIVNFLSNAIKFSSREGTVFINLRIIEKVQKQKTIFKRQSKTLGYKQNFQSSNELKQIKPIQSMPIKRGVTARGLQKQLGEEKSEKSEVVSPKKRRHSFSSDHVDDPTSELSRDTVTNKGFLVFELEIEDQGMGIPADKVDSLFINFCKISEHRKMNPSGVGLGLSICKDLLESMGGSVKVESTVGVGTKFIITFKASCILEQNEIQSARSMGSIAQLSEQAKMIQNDIMSARSISLHSIKEENQIQKHTSGNSLKCLLANDDPMCLLVTSSVAQMFFSEVVTVENGLEALQEVQKRPVTFFDVIILDINMPVMNGIQSCDLITNYLQQLNVQAFVSSKSDSGHSAMEEPENQKQISIDKNIPDIYALTADVNPESIARYLQHNFKRVYESLSVDIIKEIFELSKLDLKHFEKCQKKSQFQHNQDDDDGQSAMSFEEDSSKDQLEVSNSDESSIDYPPLRFDPKTNEEQKVSHGEERSPLRKKRQNSGNSHKKLVKNDERCITFGEISEVAPSRGIKINIQSLNSSSDNNMTRKLTPQLPQHEESPQLEESKKQPDKFTFRQ